MNNLIELLAESMQGISGITYENAPKIISAMQPLLVECGIVVFYGYSDDLICFNGTINETFTVYDKLLEADTLYFKLKENSTEVVMCEKEEEPLFEVTRGVNYDWTLKTAISQVQTFDIKRTYPTPMYKGYIFKV